MKYPLLLKPVLKDYIWGGQRLKNEYGFEAETEKVAEGWMLSRHKDGTNIILNGALAGKPFDEALQKWGYGDTFPILIKLLDANDKLSVQVHPDNEYALEFEGEYGKTEMWYVIDCKEDAKLIYGFKKDIDKADFKERIESNTLDEVMNYVSVKKGDVFFIPARTLHAIGSGILIAEIQQNSNSTYRVSDYGRLDKDGKPRELHIDKAVAVTDTKKPTVPYGATGDISQADYGTIRTLAECEYFKTVKIDLDGSMPVSLESGFASVLVLEGEISVKYGNEEIDAKKGSSLFIPCDCDCEINGKAEIIYTI